MLFLNKGGLEKRKLVQKVLSVHLIICLRSDFALFPSRILFTDFILSIFSLCRKASLLTWSFDKHHDVAFVTITFFSLPNYPSLVYSPSQTLSRSLPFVFLEYN